MLYLDTVHFLLLFRTYMYVYFHILIKNFKEYSSTFPSNPHSGQLYISLSIIMCTQLTIIHFLIDYHVHTVDNYTFPYRLSCVHNKKQDKAQFYLISFFSPLFSGFLFNDYLG